jgi:hypothetical protein
MSTLIAVIIGAVLALPGWWLAGRRPEFGYWWYGAWTIIDIGLLVFNIVTGDWGWAAWMAFVTAATAWSWWDSRRKRRRRRAMAAAGAKTRAIRDAMVRKVRQAGRPRPVLRPVPQGAR